MNLPARVRCGVLKKKSQTLTIPITKTTEDAGTTVWTQPET